MDPEQVFSTYEPTSDGLDEVVYCAKCGSLLEEEENARRRRKVCPDCSSIAHRNPFPAVSILVVDPATDKFVLCRRRRETLRGGKWCLPCGFVEFGEDYLTAALREVREETNLRVEIKGIVSVVTNTFTPQVHSLVIVLLSHLLDGDIRGGDDADLAAWYRHNAPLPELAFEADRHIIDRYFSTRLLGAPIDPRYSRE